MPAITRCVSPAPWQPALWQVWLATSALLVLVALPSIGRFAPSDPDDYMRLLQVRDWLAGQSWFDVRQYRMNPPAGADMHWSRLVDLPIAAVLLPLRVVLPPSAAEIAAMSAVPLMQLLIAMLLMRRLLRNLETSQSTVLAAIAILPLFPLLMTSFMPLRIDHHGWQALAALAAAGLLVRGGSLSALAAGWLAAVWLTISLEGLPLVATLGGLFAVRYWLWGRREHEVFLGALASAAPLLFLATRPAREIGNGFCDMLSWPHFLGFAAAAVLAGAARLVPGQERPAGRLAALLPIPLLAGPAMVWPLGACAVDPFAGLDPLLQRHWLGNIAEGLPLTAQPPSVAAMLLWTLGLISAGAWLALRQAKTRRSFEGWAMLALMALVAATMSLVVMRAALAAQLLAVPFAALLLVRLLAKARTLKAAVPRVLATLACFGFATPVLASAVLKPFDGAASAKPSAPSQVAAAGEACQLPRLAILPRAHLFAPLDLGPEILARTPHSVVAGSYHRNGTKMREVFDAFAGPVGAARRIVIANGADYLVVCGGPQHLAVYAEAGRDNLADRLLAGLAPAWLEPVPGFDGGALAVFRIR